MLATRGCLPLHLKDANTQSPGWENEVVFFHSCMNSASNGCSGTGACEALLFGTPIRPQVQVRRTLMVDSPKLTSCHCNPRHSEILSPVLAASSVRVRSGSCSCISTANACGGVRI